MAIPLILAILSFLVKAVDLTIIESADNVLRMTGFSLLIVALADIVTTTAAILSLIAQLVETLLMTIATLQVTSVIAASIQTLPIIVVALAGFVSPIVAFVEIVPVVVGSVLQMDQFALEMAESAEVAPMTVVTATTPVMMKTMLVMTLWTLSIAEVGIAFTTGLTVKSHESIETPSVMNRMVESLLMIAVELILEAVSDAICRCCNYVCGSVPLLNHYSDAESVVSEPAGPVSMTAGTPSIPTAQILLSIDRLAETLLAIYRTAGYASVIADSAVTATAATERSQSVAKTIDS
ncbi:OLC1v1031139C1 [Oldenlandia corymbosa var. corymbosa]|uniref:OLC1v1031139C1 n=1 Tax=Oldenlandia corymbosa var. corymbosa TaxID=529605 RepID=A0AAV1CIR4_OLDCO|nr:OLC1v1031139C1 [Oldenlandia corymbosa var. corymbosa]